MACGVLWPMATFRRIKQRPRAAETASSPSLLAVSAHQCGVREWALWAHSTRIWGAGLWSGRLSSTAHDTRISRSLPSIACITRSSRGTKGTDRDKKLPPWRPRSCAVAPMQLRCLAEPYWTVALLAAAHQPVRSCSRAQQPWAPSGLLDRWLGADPHARAGRPARPGWEIGDQRSSLASLANGIRDRTGPTGPALRSVRLHIPPPTHPRAGESSASTSQVHRSVCQWRRLIISRPSHGGCLRTSSDLGRLWGTLSHPAIRSLDSMQRTQRRRRSPIGAPSCPSFPTRDDGRDKQ